MADELKLWPGAVQPGRAGSVSDVLELWPGAVQPSAFGTIPDLSGLTRAAAETAITGAGFTVGTITEAQNDSVDAGDVVSQVPAASAEALLESAVDFVVSLGVSGSGGPDPSIGPVQSDDEEDLILRFIRDFLDKVA